MSRKRSAILTGAALTVLAAFGCSADTEDDGEEEVLTVATYDSSGGGDDAELSGTLSFRDGCVYIDSEDQGLVLPVFPEDVVGEVANDEVEIWDAPRAEGHEVTLAGSTTADASELTDVAGVDECSAEHVDHAWTVNPDSPWG